MTIFTVALTYMILGSVVFVRKYLHKHNTTPIKRGQIVADQCFRTLFRLGVVLLFFAVIDQWIFPSFIWMIAMGLLIVLMVLKINRRVLRELNMEKNQTDT